MKKMLIGNKILAGVVCILLISMGTVFGENYNDEIYEKEIPGSCLENYSYGKPRIAIGLQNLEEKNFEFLSENYVAVVATEPLAEGMLNLFPNGFLGFNQQYGSNITFLINIRAKGMSEYCENWTGINKFEDAFIHSADPAGLVGKPEGSFIELSWNHDSRRTIFDVAGYYIFRSTDSVNFIKVSDIITDNVFVDADVQNQDYYYLIKTMQIDGTELNYSWVIGPINPLNSKELILSNGFCDMKMESDLIVDIDCTVKVEGEPDQVMVCFNLGQNVVCNDMVKVGDGEYNFFLNDYHIPRLLKNGGILYFFKAVKEGNEYLLPEENYYTSNGNNRLKSGFNSMWIMDPGNKNWQDLYLYKVKDAITNLYYYGVHADGAGDKCPAGMYQCDDYEFALRVKDLLSKVNAELDSLEAEVGRELTLSSSILSASGNNYPFLLLEEVDAAGLDSSAYNCKTIGYREEQDWIEGLNRSIRTENEFYKIPNLDNVVEIDNIDARMFIITTYLLARGNQTTLSAEDSIYSGNLNFFPEWSIDLGKPLQEFPRIQDYYNSTVDLYERDYEKGKVFVNPKEYDILLQVPAGYQLVEISGGNVPEIGGDGKVTLKSIDTVTVKSKSGVILLSSPIAITITKPEKGHLYIFDREILPVLLGNTMIIGKITVEVDTYAEDGIEQVEFYIDSKLGFLDDESPYEWLWDEKVMGRHEIKVVAYDDEGNKAEDKTNVIIFNVGGR